MRLIVQRDNEMFKETMTQHGTNKVTFSAGGEMTLTGTRVVEIVVFRNNISSSYISMCDLRRNAMKGNIEFFVFYPKL